MHSAPLPPGHLRPKHLFLVLFGHFVNGAGQNVFLMLNRALCCRLGATAYFNEISRLFSTVTQGFTCPERRLPCKSMSRRKHEISLGALGERPLHVWSFAAKDSCPVCCTGVGAKPC